MQMGAVGYLPGAVINVSTISDGDYAAITENGSYTLTGLTTNDVYIDVANGVTAEFTLDDVSINNPASNSQSAIKLNGNAKATLIVADGTTNELICEGSMTSGDRVHAGIYVSPSATLRILGGTLNTGVLYVRGGAWCAAIGGSLKKGSNLSPDNGTIIIEGGTIRASKERRYGSVIGGALEGSGGVIEIKGNAKIFVSATLSLSDNSYRVNGIGAGTAGGSLTGSGGVTANGGYGGQITIGGNA